MAIKESDLIGGKQDPDISVAQRPLAIGNEAEKITASLAKDPNVGQISGSDVRSQIDYIERGHEAGLINDTTHSSIVIRHNGQINLSSSHYSQYKLNPSGKIVEQSMESVSMNNRTKFATNDLLINEHKLNPYLYELADMRKIVLTQNDNVLGGNFCVMGSVLVKAWDRHLKRYVMIRRPARVPLFSTILNIPEINQGLGITDPLKIDEDILAKTDKGFQVNKVVTDSNSIIGKDGQDRAGGTDRSRIIEFNDESTSTPTTETGGISGGTTDLSFTLSTSGYGNQLAPKGSFPPNSGADKLGTDGPLHNSDPEDIQMVIMCANEIGIPADWLYAQFADEVGLDSYSWPQNRGRYVSIHNYGNWFTNGEGTPLRSFSSNEEWAKEYGLYIRRRYNDPSAPEQKTPEAYFKALQSQDGGKTMYCANPPGDEYVQKIIKVGNGRLPNGFTRGV